MKTYLTCILFIAGFLAGCQKDQDNGSFILNQEVKLKAGTLYTCPSDPFSVKITRITDSRCPEGVYCIWQGEATVYLEVKEIQSGEVVLSTVHQPVDTVNNYVFKLMDVLPYPKYQVEIPDSEKIVVLQINKL
jgi:hypothetical protein